MRFTHLKSNVSMDDWGYIPSYLNEQDPRPARQQLDANYRPGGGWIPFKGFTMDAEHGLRYPGDPVQRPISMLRFREERIFLYPGSWVNVIQPDGSWEVCRMD